MAMVRALLPGVGIAQQIAVGERPPRKLQSEGQSAVVETTHYDDRRYGEHIDPAGRRVWSATHLPVLRHRLIDRWHLSGRVDVAIEMLSIHRVQVHLQCM